MKQEPKTVDDVIADLESQELHPLRQLSRKLVEQYRITSRSAAPEYDFDAAPKELKRVMYGGTVRWSRRSLWSKLFRR